jgi:hypothetical protein
VALGIGLGILAALLTYGKTLGLGATLYALLWLGGLVYYARSQQVKVARRNLFMVVPALFFAIMLAVRADDTLTLLNLGMGLVTLTLWLDFFNIGNLARLNVFSYPLRILAGLFAVWVQPLGELEQARQWFGAHKGFWKHALPVIRGALITLPVVSVFVILLASADPVFSKVIADLVEGLIPQNAFAWTTEWAYAGLFAWLTIGGLSFAVMDSKPKRRPDPKTAAETPAEEQPAEAVSLAQPFKLGFIETLMLLSGLCLVFALFVGIQFVYLFGGARNIGNFSYADYARRGFAELVAVGVLTLGLAFTLEQIATRSTRRAEDVFRGLVVVLFVLTGVILVSAFVRMHLYEVTYGFTALRLAVYVSICWLGVLFIGFALSLYWHPLMIDVFGTTALIAVIGFAVTLNLLNPDAFVARENIGRGDIDPLYLSTLSFEAVPELVKLIDSEEPGLRAVIRQRLRNQQRKLKNDAGLSDWRAFNLGRQNALSALEGVKLDDEAAGRGTFAINEFEGILRKGQTVRETIRRYGSPLWITSTSRYTNTVDVGYVVAGPNTLVLSFDSTDGLLSACINPTTNTKNCLTLLPK